MARISVIRNTYGGTQYLQNALNYVTDERALYGGGYGVNPYDSHIAYNQMIQTGFDEMNAYCNFVTQVTGQKAGSILRIKYHTKHEAMKKTGRYDRS